MHVSECTNELGNMVIQILLYFSLDGELSFPTELQNYGLTLLHSMHEVRSLKDDVSLCPQVFVIQQSSSI